MDIFQDFIFHLNNTVVNLICFILIYLLHPIFYFVYLWYTFVKINVMLSSHLVTAKTLMREVQESETAVMNAMKKSKQAMDDAMKAKRIGEAAAKNITMLIKVLQRS